jgi:ABC-type Fe3+ transport system permease subunit
VPVEVRSKLDPYTVWTESEYNMGRDLTIFFWLSIVFVATAFLITIILSFCICFVVRRKKDGQGRYVE